MDSDINLKEKMNLALLKKFGPIKGERNLFSLMYLAQKYADNGQPGISFSIDIFGINSNEMRDILNKLEREGKIRITPSNELDPDLLVSKYNIYSINGHIGGEEFGNGVLEILDKLMLFYKIGCRNLAAIIYLHESTSDWTEAIKIGKRLGLREDDIRKGLECMKQISSY